MMRHVRGLWGSFLEERRKKKNGDKMETLKGVRGRKDVKRVRNGGREEEGGRERGGEITRNNYMNSELLNGIHFNY